MSRLKYVASTGVLGFGTVALGVFSGAAGATPATDGSSSTNVSDNTVNIVHSQQGNCSSLQVVQTGNNAQIGNGNGNGNGNINVGNNAARDGMTPFGGTALGTPGGGAPHTNVSISTNNGNGNGNGNGITQKAANCNTVVTPTVTKTVVVPHVVTKTVVQQQQVVTKPAVGVFQQVQQAPVAAPVTTTAHFTG